MLVTLSEILAPAQNEKYAVIAPDFLSIGMLKHYLRAAEKYGAPIIASYPPLPIDRFRRYDRWIGKIRTLCRESKVPVCLHLDHGKNVQICLRAVAAGFTSVMIDASAFDLDLNLKMTRRTAQAARQAGVSVEAEIGHVGANKDSMEGKAQESNLTDPEQAAFFARETGVDALAVSIGTLHGTYKGEPHIDFGRLEAIKEAVDVPLVLHGGSGTGEDNLRRCVAGGICKINVFTELIKAYLPATKAGFNPLVKGNPGFHQYNAVDKILEFYFTISGSMGVASA
ncbi:fructose-bisphosphate aldolase, class II [Desulfatibacillum alkenivorans DSM 16219]|jgi:ketose-bisphosphate aldolase|uniref:Fructose-bisphosphate aldolase, class II n=1 Tax=Desulfatibacillum alkenivorans DSM 16219 TaxID=1121393 RepID=A0A1M6LCL6_9BACT|nr:class II fructose-bisphosphate aldolase [Desulfatibacillum alkenivorans]SHJ68933.1 fructose-bisphosphate aldolase, class II [Desulfatibacillum alkenivorans DSM 16219]